MGFSDWKNRYLALDSTTDTIFREVYIVSIYDSTENMFSLRFAAVATQLRILLCAFATQNNARLDHVCSRNQLKWACQHNLYNYIQV